MYNRTEAIWVWTSLGNGPGKAAPKPMGKSLLMFRSGEGHGSGRMGGREWHWACQALPSLLADHPGKS